MRRILCSMLIVGSVSVLNASQQSSAHRLDFSGTWTYYRAAYEGGGNRPAAQLHVGTPPTKLVISQEQSKLRIMEHRQIIVPLNTLEYDLNGQPSKSQVAVLPSRPEPSFREALSATITSKWEQGSLVSNITVVVPDESVPRQYVETLSISPEGLLTVTIQRAGTEDSRTSIYRKAN